MSFQGGDCFPLYSDEEILKGKQSQCLDHMGLTE